MIYQDVITRSFKLVYECIKVHISNYLIFQKLFFVLYSTKTSSNIRYHMYALLFFHRFFLKLTTTYIRNERQFFFIFNPLFPRKMSKFHIFLSNRITRSSTMAELRRDLPSSHSKRKPISLPHCI